LISDDSGCIISLYSPQKAEEKETLELYQKKLLKNFGRDNMLKCIPIMWHELKRLKSRVESVISNLSTKTVQKEKLLEFKKQLVSNKSLKSYFEEHPDEKDILLNDISKMNKGNNRFLFQNLDVMPSYVIPEGIMAMTAE